MISFRNLEKFDKDATVILISKEQAKNKIFQFKQSKLEEELKNLLKNGQFSGDKEEMFPLIVKGGLVLIVGLGKIEDLSLTALRIVVKKALTSAFLKTCKAVEIIPHSPDTKSIVAIIEGHVLGTYKWDKYKTKAKDDKTVSQKEVVVVAPAKKEFAQAVAICNGVNLTRNLVNDNADVVTSVLVEKTVKDLIKGNTKISVEILNRKEMEAKGLGLHLAVNRGSTKEPKLIIVKYSGGKSTDDYTAVLGKGMTFDTGGLNLKPTNHIETMRIDMSGAGAVVGMLKIALELKIPKNIIFAMGMAENAIGPDAYKPGDVFTGYAGKSVEIGNTDAEGRLVLADAIAYLVKNYKPGRIIDLATLTGACVVALGFDYSGLFSNNDELARKLVHASNETDDRVWRLPVYPEIKDYIKSQIADLKNTSSIRGAGACTAAEFLRSFTDGTDWAHLDIAGSAFVDNGARMYFGHGATGAGVRVVTHYLLNN
jgi:leucyl aminopeptidase